MLYCSMIMQYAISVGEGSLTVLLPDIIRFDYFSNHTY